MCTTPIDRSVPKTWEEMMTTAVTKFDSAIVIANAAKAYYATLTPAQPTAVLAADSVINFANVGAARASLNKNDKVKAIAYATLVPAGFVFNNYYSDNTTAQRHRTYERIGRATTARSRARRSRRWPPTRGSRGRPHRRRGSGPRSRRRRTVRSPTRSSVGRSHRQWRCASRLSSRGAVHHRRGAGADGGDAGVREHASCCRASDAGHADG